MHALSAAYRLCILILVLAAVETSAGTASALQSDWVDGYNTRSRLEAAKVETGGTPRLMAFVEIELDQGWKTYWRTPGDAGGLPPAFDWSKSENLASANVLYPAPARTVDKAGNTLGYHDRVLFPVELKAKDAAKPIGLDVTVHYGICKDICVPVDTALSLEVPPATAEAPSEDAAAALERVPRAQDALRSDDPVLTKATAELDGPKPRLVLEATFPGGGAGADIFLEAPDAAFIPLPAKTADLGGGKLVFEADLSKDVDLAELRGKPITVTLVSAKGASVATVPLQ